MTDSRVWILNKKFGYVVLSLIILLGTVFVFASNTRRIPSSCAELRRIGRTNIHKGDADYNPALDRDKNQIACQS